MSVFKPLSSKDIIVTPFTVHKSFSFTAEEFEDSGTVGIDRFLGVSEEGLYTSGSDQTGVIAKQSKRLIYRSIRQLYYSNYASGSIGSGSFQNSLQSSLFDARNTFPQTVGSEIGVLSIPSKLYGEYIRPKSLNLTLADSILTDDGEGNIKIGGLNVGNIIYSQGIIILTVNDPAEGGNVAGAEYGVAEYGNDVYGSPGSGLIDTLISTDNVTCSFDSSLTIYESQYKCTFLESDYNYSYNPSLSKPESTSKSGSLVYNDYVTSSFFSPYVTTVGLYNNNQELLAVGKLAQPLPTSQTTDTTILINIDL
jgi:hypothetical protein